MIIIVARFETDGDYSVDNETAGLASPPDDDYCHCGAFLCADHDEAAAVLLRVVRGVKDKGNYYGGIYHDHIFSWLTNSVNDALHLLRNASEILRFGWSAATGGNYDGTFIFMQEVKDELGVSGRKTRNGGAEMEMEYFPKGVIIKTLEAAQREAAKQDEKFVHGLEAAIRILRNAEPLDFAEAMSRATPKKPILRNNDKYWCKLNECPTCGHIVEGVESWELFAYCPACGQRIDWDGAARDALGGGGEESA